MKFTRLIVPTLAAVALLSGCGKSSDPVSAPSSITLDTTPPPVPQSLAIVPHEVFPGEPVLTWAASSAPDLAMYEVFHYSPDPARDESFALLGESDGAMARYGLQPVGSPTTKYFRVRAVDAAGNRSTFSPTLTVVLRPASTSPGNDTNGDSEPDQPDLGRMSP